MGISLLMAGFFYVIDEFKHSVESTLDKCCAITVISTAT